MATDSRDIFIDLAKTRTEEQLYEYEKILHENICPFCAEGRDEYTRGDRLHEGQYWWAFENNWPYQNTQRHIIVPSQTHWVYLEDIEPASGNELFKQFAKLELTENYQMGAIVARFGFVLWTGASVAHLHVHFILPDLNGPDGLRDSFALGEEVKGNSAWTAYVAKYKPTHTRAHFYVVSNLKTRRISDMDENAGQRLIEIFQFLEGKYSLTHGGFKARLGEYEASGDCADRIVFEFSAPEDHVSENSEVKVRFGISENPQVDFKIST